MTWTPSLDQLLDLAEAVAADGVPAHRPEMDAVVFHARDRGVRPVLVEILEDPTVPEAVQQRALGRLIVALCTPSRVDEASTCDPSDPPAQPASAAA